ncbi:MAG TPA: hypothetical protein VF624_05115 [Tepidisphaeraceae bacterium]|jgi:hypothetical protein
MTSPRAILTILLTSAACGLANGNWQHDPLWHDGLVEKAAYDATRIVYGKPRAYTAIFFTNKEQHDPATLTKSDTPPAAKKTIEVFKHNQIEVVPTPNYDYKFTTTSHLRVGDLSLTRLDMGSQEFCGASFKQYFLVGTQADVTRGYGYFAYSYMPGEGRVQALVKPAPPGVPAVAFNSLPLWLRGFDFASKKPLAIELLPDQKFIAHTPHNGRPAEVRFVGEDVETCRLEVVLTDVPGGERVGTFTFAKDRLRVMTRYESADGAQTYTLKSQERVNYWSRSE